MPKTSLRIQDDLMHSDNHFFSHNSLPPPPFHVTFSIELKSYYNYLGGKLPSPPRQLGLFPTTPSPLLIFSCHFSGVYATILNACIGPSLATSSFKVELINRCLDIGVLVLLNADDITITLKCVSESFGLYKLI